VCSDNDEHVLELGPDVGNERKSSGLLQLEDVFECRRYLRFNTISRLKNRLYLKDYGNNVVAYVSLPWQLLSEMEEQM
jgi:hypothetical protein